MAKKRTKLTEVNAISAAEASELLRRHPELWREVRFHHGVDGAKVCELSLYAQAVLKAEEADKQ